MGILDKWTKKTSKSQLSASTKKASTKSAKNKSENKKEAVVETNVTKAPVVDAKKAAHYLVNPLISEKAAHGESQGVYTFFVKKEANKIEIKKAVKEVYGVEPVSVRIINKEGRLVRFGRNMGKRVGVKKAMVVLPKGKSIQIHEGV